MMKNGARRQNYKFLCTCHGGTALINAPTFKSRHFKKLFQHPAKQEKKGEMLLYFGPLHFEG
jgi:hypothetical protein